MLKIFNLLTTTSAETTEEVVETVKEGFNLSQHIQDNIWAYGAVGVVLFLGFLGAIVILNHNTKKKALAIEAKKLKMK